MDERDSPQIPWRDIIAVLLRRRRLVLSVATSGVATALVLSFLQPPVYRASAKLMVTSKRAHMTVSPDPKDGPTINRVTDQDLNSEVALLQSASLVHEVLATQQEQQAQVVDHPDTQHRLAKLLTVPLRLPGKLYSFIHDVAPPSPLEEWVQRTVKRLSVSSVKGSDLIEVAYEGTQPQWAADLVNKLITRHVERHVQLNQQSDALGFFESQRRLLSERLHDAEEALQKFYGRESVDPGAGQRETLTAQLGTLHAALAQSETDLAEVTARAGFLSQAVSQPRSFLGDGNKGPAGPQQMIRTRILELELQRSELLSKFAPTSMKIQDLDRQIAEAHRLLTEERKSGIGTTETINPTRQRLELQLTQTQAQMAAIKARAEALAAHITTSEAKLQHLDQIASEQERLEQEVSSAKESLLTYIKKQEEARFSDALDESHIVNVSIVERADVPMTPLPSKRWLIFALGSVMSFLGGVALAFFRDRLDPAVKGSTEAQNLTGLPILADIPL